MSGISATSMAGIQQGLQMIDKAAGRVNAATSGQQTDDLASAVVDVNDAKIQTQASVNSFEAGDAVFQSIIDIMV